MKRAAIIAVFIIFVSAQISAVSAIQQSKSITEETGLKAREVLQAGIKALGGLDALREVKDITRELDGVRTDEGQGLRPVPHKSDYFNTVSAPVTNHPKVTSIRDMRKERAVDHLRDVILGGQPVEFISVVDAKTVFTANPVTRSVRVRPASAVASARASMFRRYPEGLLLSAWSSPRAVRWLGQSQYGGQKQQVISFADSEGALITMHFDAKTNLLTKTEVLGDTSILGDIVTEVVYSDYRPVGKLMLPFRYVDKVGGVMLQDMKATSITLDTNPPDQLFAIPEGFTQPAPPPSGSTPKKLAEDVYVILGSYNVLFVVFKDYVLVVEAGQSTGAARNVIAQIKAVAPGKPIRYVISTHFHFDHISGVRSYIAEGITIVATPDAKRAIEEAAVRKHLLQPDALSLNPRAPIIETITKKRVFDDGTHTVELYDIGPNPHCAEMIIVYLPKEKILVEADMLDLEIPEGGTAVAGEDTADLADKIKSLGLQVEQIVPIHGRMGTMDDLQRALAKQAK